MESDSLSTFTEITVGCGKVCVESDSLSTFTEITVEFKVYCLLFM